MRYIKITNNLKQKAIDTFMAQLNQGRFTNNKINFSFDLEKPKDDTKVILNIQTDAWLKMWALVSTENNEIGWHGIVRRHSDTIFELTDILIYPQYVTSITVETDDIEYANWLHKELSDDEINNLRFHGHSHVNMGVTPSGVDTTWYSQILQGLNEDDFYIFMVLNKKENFFIEIYDLKTNMIYEKEDITLNVICKDNNYLNNWITNNKEKYLRNKHSIITTSTQSNEVEFRDILLNITKEDLRDTSLKRGIMQELDEYSLETNFYGIGYMKWSLMTDTDKIYTAQNYYSFKPKKYKKEKKGKISYDQYY